MLVAALTLLPWRPDDATAIQSGLGVAAAMAAAAAVVWLALAVLTAKPVLPDPGRALPALWAVAFVLITIQMLRDMDGLQSGAWTAQLLALALGAVASRRRLRNRATASP